MAAGAATLRVLAEPNVYERLEATGGRVEESLRAAADAAGRAVTINRLGPMLTMFFCEGPVRSFAEAKGSDTAAFASYWRHMLERGVYLAPSQFEAAMISLALTDDDLELAAAAAHDWFAGAGA
jgi:glutamate-1-semialdehyde 2,1-aminomutase